MAETFLPRFRRKGKKKKKIFSYPGKENGLKRDGVEREIKKKKSSY